MGLRCHQRRFAASAVRLLAATALAGALLGCQAGRMPMPISEAAIEQWTDVSGAPANAHWIDWNWVVVPNAEKGAARLLFLPADVSVDDKSDNGADDKSGAVTSIALVPGKLPQELMDKYPHLAKFSAYTLHGSSDALRNLMTRPARFIISPPGQPDIVDLRKVQMAGAIDALFTGGDHDADEVTDYGARISGNDISFKLWAPTAETVAVRIFGPDFQPLETLPLRRDYRSGVWHGEVGIDMKGAWYQYQIHLYRPETGDYETVTVTDPYALSLSSNGAYSQIADLDDPEAAPPGWIDHEVPTLDRPEQHIIYETHIGDFSKTDLALPQPVRGLYEAFAHEGGEGRAHLKRLRAAGVNSVQILPAFDFGSVNEDPALRAGFHDPLGKACALLKGQAPFCAKGIDQAQSMADYLAGLDPKSSDAQAAVSAVAEIDDFNWGYDPVHFSVPEGSYALEPDGTARSKSFRKMVQALHEMGFRVIMDVVYNHTHRSGLEDMSVLDKIVPGYYHRLDVMSGEVETSTCCENTATEHKMMAKLMTDSLLVWTRDYKIDGFRFDLMGHQPRRVMLDARAAVQRHDPDSYFYGEGWDFGEVADGARFVQAAQEEMAGSEIGTFSDRLRDAVRGGSSFVQGDALRAGQGLGNGLYLMPNELAGTEREQFVSYQSALDQVRLGLAANLADYELITAKGESKSGEEISYGDGAAGYAHDPADIINYVSKHDNQTLWDNNQYRIDFKASSDMRARMQAQSLSFVLYAQGLPFLHMGSELARSKSFARDSYNYGHWFNWVDFTGEAQNYDAGLPPAAKDQESWELITRLREANEGRDHLSREQIKWLSGAVLDMVRVRSASPLFSLPEKSDIKARLQFLNTGPGSKKGLIIMSLDDGYHNKNLEDIDPDVREIIVVFNLSPVAKTIQLDDMDALALHPALAASRNSHIGQVEIFAGQISLPGFTTSVFIRPQ